MTLPNPHFEASYARLFGDEIGMGDAADDFFRAFYIRFRKDPSIANLFAHTDIDRQVVMLKKSLFQLVTYYVVGEVTAELDRLAQIHKQLGVPADSFDAWMQALLETAAEFDEAFNETTELAWCWALAPGLAYMRTVLSAAEPVEPTSHEDENHF